MKTGTGAAGAATGAMVGGLVWGLVTFFSPSEFADPDIEGSGYNMDSTLVWRLDRARAEAGVPFKINSGYRSHHRNKWVGGKKDSSHLTGHAVDIHCNNSRDRYIIVNALLEQGFNRIGIGSTFIHADNDTTKSEKVIWLY